jgi:hypothetical protein
MRILILILCTIRSFSVSAQKSDGFLLLLKIDKVNNLKVDKIKSSYLAIELDSDYNLKKNTQISKPVYFKDFTDGNLFSCTQKDSIRLKTLISGDTFNHDNTLGNKNFNTIESSLNKMKNLMHLSIKSSLYNQEVKISYILISCNYCIGVVAKYDANFIGYTGEAILVIDKLTVNGKYKLPDTNMYSIIKNIDFNGYLF